MVAIHYIPSISNAVNAQKTAYENQRVTAKKMDIARFANQSHYKKRDQNQSQNQVCVEIIDQFAKTV